MKRKKKQNGIDPSYLEKQRKALRRTHRKTILLNDAEIAAIEEYCRRYRVSSKSALIREATMEMVLKTLDESHPTLF